MISKQIFQIRIRILESNPKGFELLKTYLAVSLWTQCFGKNITDSLCNALLATELCDSSVDCHTSHDRDKSVSHLASIYIEDCLESTSHNSYFLFGAKLNYESFIAKPKLTQNGEI